MSTELERKIRLNLSCALAQALMWCPLCGDVHMLGARCARELDRATLQGAVIKSDRA